MQIVSIGNNLHEMSNPVFWEKSGKITNLLSAELAQRVVKVKNWWPDHWCRRQMNFWRTDFFFVLFSSSSSSSSSITMAALSSNFRVCIIPFPFLRWILCCNRRNAAFDHYRILKYMSMGLIFGTGVHYSAKEKAKISLRIRAFWCGKFLKSSSTHSTVSFSVTGQHRRWSDCANADLCPVVQN